MPQVPVYGQPKVDLEPLPGARKTAAETPESEGAGVGEAIGTLGNTAAAISTAEVARMTREAQQQADDVVALNANNQIATWENKTLYDPNTGALAQKGQAALGLPEQVSGSFATLTDGIEAGMNDRQKAAFQKVKSARQIDVNATIQRHVFGEMQTYEGQELNDSIENHRQLAIANASDPRRVGVELQGALSDLQQSGARLGLGPQAMEDQAMKITTATHVGVIDRLLENGQSKQAQIYYDETKDGISGDQQGAIEKALHVGTVRTDAQQLSDAITKKGGSLSDQIQAVKDAGATGDTRDEAIRYIKENNDVQEKQQRDDTEALVSKAYTSVFQTGRLNSISPSDQVKLGAHIEPLQRYAEFLAKGEPVATDWPTYYARMNEASTSPDTFQKRNLLDDRAKLDDADFKQLVELKSSIQNGDRKRADEGLAPFRTHQEIVNNSLTNYGLDPEAKPNTAQGKANAELYRLVDQGVANAEAQTPGKKASNQDIQSIVDHVLSTNQKTPGSWWALVPGSGVPLGNFTSRTKNLLDLTPADIPADMRQGIERQLRASGRAVSDATVLELYQQTLARQQR